jgi:Deoxyribonuclease NucA/NucB
MNPTQVKRLSRLAGRSLSALAAGLALAFLTTLPALASQSPPARNGLAAAVRAATTSTCPPRTHWSGITVRCVRVRRLTVGQLSPADRALMHEALAEIASGSPGHLRIPALPLRRPAAAAPVIPPAQCVFVPGALVDPDRFTACVDSLWQFTDLQITDGVPHVIGTFDMNDLQWASFSGTSGSWTHGMLTMALTGTGSLLGGFEAELYSGCFLAQGICAAVSLTSPDPQTVTILPRGTYAFGWSEFDRGPSSLTTGAANNLSTVLGVQFLNTAPDGATAPFFDNLRAGRCDTIARRTDGCVNQNFTPTLTYSGVTHPLVAPVAQHIFTAEHTLAVNWGVPPGHFANDQPLTRDMNPADIRLNNIAACQGVTVPPGDSCDEYPLATTHQGAAFQNAFSAVPVPSRANNSQGGTTRAFYASNRVIDGDPFYVLAILANGTPSW